MSEKEEFKEILLDQISLSPYQMRKIFDEEEINLLAHSIKNVGLIQPIVVRKKASGYQLIAGERRYRALKKLERQKAGVFITKKGDVDAAHAALVENIQRVDLNPIEIAKCYQQLMNQFSLTQEEVSFRVGKNRSTVANFLRLLSLPDQVQSSLMSRAISMGHAKALLSLPTKELQTLLHKKIIRDNLSVRETERLTKKSASNWRKKEVDPHFEALKARLEERFLTKVDVKPGKLVFEWDSLDALDHLLEQWKVEI